MKKDTNSGCIGFEDFVDISINYFLYCYALNFSSIENENETPFWFQNIDTQDYVPITPGPPTNPLTWWVDHFYPSLPRLALEALIITRKHKIEAVNILGEAHFRAVSKALDLSGRISREIFFKHAAAHFFGNQKIRVKYANIEERAVFCYACLPKLAETYSTMVPIITKDPRWDLRYERLLKLMPNLDVVLPDDHPLPPVADVLKPANVPCFHISDFKPQYISEYDLSNLKVPEMLIANLGQLKVGLEMEDDWLRCQLDAWFPDFYDRLFDLLLALVRKGLKVNNIQFVTIYIGLDIMGNLLSSQYIDELNSLFEVKKNSNAKEKEEVRVMQRAFVATLQDFFQKVEVKPQEMEFLHKYRKQAGLFRDWLEL
jgi:hypothetical protein